MSLGPQTKVHDLLEEHPYLLDWLAGYAPEFAKLKNPVLFNTVARVATLEAAAALAGRPVEELLDAIAVQIARHGIAAQEHAPATASRLSSIDLARRKEALKDLIRRLHDGEDVQRVKADFDALTRDIEASEIARIEQALIAEGMPAEEVQRLCDVHVTVFKEALESTAPDEPLRSLPADHPVSRYLAENDVVRSLAAETRAALDTGSLDDLVRALDRLAELDIHYARKENQLFPVLERHGIEGPTKVMWGLDDEIRERIATARRNARAGDLTAVRETLPETLRMVEDMVYKEEKILLPTALSVISEDEWRAMAEGDAEIGYAWGIAGDAAVRSARTASAPAASHVRGSATGTLELETGALAPDALRWMLRVVPFDLTFIDEHDRVRFYSEGDRVFPRSPEVIGREVRNCHPPKSVAKVEQILAAFKAGEKDVAEFWIEFHGRFIHIRYFAVRDDAGVYRGCLEVVQDATRIRELQGERRLVNW